MVLDAQLMSVEEFEQFVDLPHNADKKFEYIGGEIVEVPTNAYASHIAFEIGFLIRSHIKENNVPAHMIGADGGFKIGGDRYAPDVGFMLTAKQAKFDKEGYNSVAPDLAVEVVSSNTTAELNTLRVKVTNYLSVGTTVWVVNPDEQKIEVHQTGQAVIIYRKDDTLEGGDMLPGFTMKLSDIFNEAE